MSPVRGGGIVSAAVTVHADGSFGPVRHAADLACPFCGHVFEGCWPAGRDTAAQQCPACGHVFDGEWPGFRFEPETVTVRPGAGPAQANDTRGCNWDSGGGGR